jgi:hypothetical protein
MSIETIEAIDKSIKDGVPGGTDAQGADKGEPTGGINTGADGEIERIARDMGWKPESEFDGAKEVYVDAAEYIRRGKDIQDNMRKLIKEQRKQLAGVDETLRELKKHNERVYKAEITNIKKELGDLKSKKREAIEEGDVEKVEQIDEQIGALEESLDTKKVAPPDTRKKTAEDEAASAEFDAWVKNNKWYEENPEMAAYADQIAEDNPALSFRRVSLLAEKKVKEAFPEAFGNKNGVSEPPRVEGSARGNRGRSGSRVSKSSLTNEQRFVMQQFVSRGVMTEKQYLEDLAKMADGGA